MELNKIKQDLELESQGIWKAYRGTDFKCRIARIGNPRFEEASRELRQQARIRAIAEGDDLDSADINQSMDDLAEIVAKCVLLDWEGLTENGEEVKYSPAKAVELLKRRDLRDWYAWILKVSNNAELYRRRSQAADLGN